MSPAIRSRWLLVVALVATASLPAQDIIRPTARDPLLPAILREHQPPPPASQPPALPDTPFKFGRVVAHPGLSYSYMNAEGLPAPDGRRIASEIHTVNAGVSVDVGEHWSLTYSPTWVNYSARAMTDSFDQAASVGGAFAFGSWGFQFSESYSQSTPTLVETGRQTKQETWASSVSAGYSFTSSVQLQMSASMDEMYTDIATDTRTWSTGTELVVAFTPRFSLKLGPSFNYSEIVDAPDQYSESYAARFSWSPSDKLVVGFDTGMQYNHSTSSAGLSVSNPTLNFSLGYQPFETTSLSFTAAQTVTPSYFGGQVTKNFRWGISLNQRFFGRFYFTASYSPYDVDYTATDTRSLAVEPSLPVEPTVEEPTLPDEPTVTPLPSVAGRKDKVSSYSASLSTQLFGRMSISARFSLNENKSNLPGFSFSSKQYGVQVGYSF